jgi:hypothetical protein
MARTIWLSTRPGWAEATCWKVGQSEGGPHGRKRREEGSGLGKEKKERVGHTTGRKEKWSGPARLLRLRREKRWWEVWAGRGNCGPIIV